MVQHYYMTVHSTGPMMEVQAISQGDRFKENNEEIDLSPFKGDKVLQLNYKGLKKLPSQLTETTDFRHITNLYLKRNLLVTLPEEIRLLQNLVVLYLHSNKLTSLPESIGELTNLESLDVGTNFLTSLPESIGRLCKLTSLKLAYNMVTHLPRSMGNLHQLVTLEAMNNQLKSLPLELFECVSLESLCVDSNQLQVIPRQICKLSRLKELSATGNNLIILPQGLGKNDNLKSVLVDCNCHLSVLPMDLLKKQVGFYRCGSLPLSKVSDSILSNICHVTIKHSKTMMKALPLPWEIRQQGNLTDASVPSLLELALRYTHSSLHYWDDHFCVDNIPRMFVPLLETPTAECYKCHTSVFTMAFPMVFQSHLQGHSVYLLGLCCSVRCLRQCTFMVNLPLVYPTMENLFLAIALI